MRICSLVQCSDAADGRFVLAPGASRSTGRSDEDGPVLLCHWHALLYADHRAQPAAASRQPDGGGMCSW